MRVVAIIVGLAALAAPALAQTRPATSDRPSAAASPAATVKTGSERDREERAAEQGRLSEPETGARAPSGVVLPEQNAPASKEE